MTVSLAPATDLSQGTFEAWVKTAWDWTDEGRHWFVGVLMDGGAPSWGLRCVKLTHDGRPGVGKGLTFSMNDSTGEHSIARSGRDLGWRRGEWHHIAASWTPRASRLFADGQLVASATYVEPVVFTAPSTALWIGITDWPYGTSCGAFIDEVRVCDEALYMGRDTIPLGSETLSQRLPGPRRLTPRRRYRTTPARESARRAAGAPIFRIPPLGARGDEDRVGRVSRNGPSRRFPEHS